MLQSARFALFVGLSAAIPMAAALNPPQKQDQNKQQTKDDNKKTAEATKKETPPANERLNRRDIRMDERNRKIDSLVNKQKK